MARADKLFVGRIPLDDAAFMGAGRIDSNDRLGFLDISRDGDRFFVGTESFYGTI